MYSIAIIGGGSIGRRHLQATLGINSPVSISVVDPSEEALATVREMSKDIPQSKGSVQCSTSLSRLPKSLDLAIVATSSTPRLEIITTLLDNLSISNMILEKVLFSNLEEYEKAEEAISLARVPTWVNHIVRSWPFYQELKMRGEKLLSMNASGSLLNLASNSLHYIDLVSYLSGCSSYNVDCSALNPKFSLSKRPGYIECTGMLSCKFEDGAVLTIDSFESGSIPSITDITTSKSRYRLFEDRAEAVCSSEESGWAWKSTPYSTPFLSKAGSIQVDKILTSGKCDLPTFGESTKLHKPFIEALHSFWMENSKFNDGLTWAIT